MEERKRCYSRHIWLFQSSSAPCIFHSLRSAHTRPALGWESIHKSHMQVLHLCSRHRSNGPTPSRFLSLHRTQLVRRRLRLRLRLMKTLTVHQSGDHKGTYPETAHSTLMSKPTETETEIALRWRIVPASRRFSLGRRRAHTGMPAEVPRSEENESQHYSSIKKKWLSHERRKNGRKRTSLAFMANTTAFTVKLVWRSAKIPAAMTIGVAEKQRSHLSEDIKF